MLLPEAMVFAEPEVAGVEFSVDLSVCRWICQSGIRCRLPATARAYRREVLMLHGEIRGARQPEGHEDCERVAPAE